MLGKNNQTVPEFLSLNPSNKIPAMHERGPQCPEVSTGMRGKMKMPAMLP